MSIQTKIYKSKKTGKSTTKYYPVVFDPKTNKTIWGSGFKTEREAKKAEGKLLEELDSGKISIGSKRSETFGSVAELWLKTSKNTYADSTWRVYEYDYHHFIEPIFGDRKINQINKKNVLTFKTILEERNYKPETINKIINIVTNIFNFAVNEIEIIPESPIAGMKKLRCKVEEVKHTTWTEDQITYFLELPIVIESPYYAMLITMFATGARPGEICGLAETDLTRQRILTLNRGLNRFGNTSDLKNVRSHRPLKLSAELYDLIFDQLKRKRKQDLQGLTDGEITAKDRNDFLFVSLKGTPVKPDTLSKNFKRLLRRNNKECEEILREGDKLPANRQILPDMRLYDSRHSFATNLMIDGKKSKVIAEVMGNSVKTMEHHYAHVTEAMHEEVLGDYGAKVIPLRKLS